jgi:hypothetical protein
MAASHVGIGDGASVDALIASQPRCCCVVATWRISAKALRPLIQLVALRVVHGTSAESTTCRMASMV